MSPTEERAYYAAPPLSHELQMQLKEFEDMRDDFIALCRKAGNSRELSLAITNMQQAGFWAREHVLSKP